MKPKWLSRRVAAPGPYLMLVLNQAEFDSAWRQCRVSERFPYVRRGSDAATHLLENGSGECVAIVALGPVGQREPIEIAGLLVHEAVHVWQNYRDAIGEARPGDEQEAYAVQAIAQELMAEYVRRLA